MAQSGISIRLIVTDAGVLHAINARGHALKHGADSLACGVVSHILRSFARCLTDQTHVVVQGKNLQSGEFDLRVVKLPTQYFEWFRGMQELLVKSLLDASQDFPNDIEIKFQTLEQEI